MTSFSKYFGLNKSQSELDFVNVPTNGDIRLFLDPFAIGQRPEQFSQRCHETLVAFFQRVIDAIRGGKNKEAQDLLLHLREPNETRFGFSRDRPQGAGVGDIQSQQLLQALKRSSAVKTGFLNSLEECELMVEGIGRDKVSDLTTNIIRLHLADYTTKQCGLLDIETQSVPLGPYFCSESECWKNDYYNLPVADGKPVLLVPKVFARFIPAYNQGNYYQHYVLNYLQAEELSAGSSLVRTLKNGKRIVCKKDIKPKFPHTKENLFRFSQDHPEVLAKYRDQLASAVRTGKASEVDEEEQDQIAEMLISALKSIKPGSEDASAYHDMMIGIVEFLFFPYLVHPIKEREIHSGRKRIDIVMQNGARNGIFYQLHTIRKVLCPEVMIECKNYGREIGNPELDQIAGRFSPYRGKFGIITCRTFEDRRRFVKRCQDTLKDDRGLIVALDDDSIIECLGLIKSRHRHLIDKKLTELVRDVYLD